jgi:RNA polymerase sigma-70 factor (ECF subfamily)
VVEESDEVLMERFCAGDAVAFDALFDRHARAVRAYLANLVGDAAAADDLTQVTFVSVVRARGRFLKGSRFTPWLYAIATNAARDSRRRRAKETLVAEPPREDGVEPVTRDAGLEKAVRSALATLPEAQREAIVLHRFQELSFKEIAQALGLTESAVKVRAHRGYERLRELLQGVWKGEG